MAEDPNIGGISATLFLELVSLIVVIVGAFLAWMLKTERRQTRLETRHDALANSYGRFKDEQKEEHERIEGDLQDLRKDHEKRIRQVERDNDRHHYRADATDDRGLGRDDV